MNYNQGKHARSLPLLTWPLVEAAYGGKTHFLLCILAERKKRQSFGQYSYNDLDVNLISMMRVIS